MARACGASPFAVEWGAPARRPRHEPAVRGAMRLFTTAEAAEYLRLKERKVYELVAEGAIPCTKVTGKWLVPQQELDHWLPATLVRPKALRPRDALPIVRRSHAPQLEWPSRESAFRH